MFKFALFALIAVAAVICSAKEAEDLFVGHKEAHEECKKETGLDGEAFHKALMGGAPDDKAKQHALCYGSKIGLTDSDGKPSLDKMKKMLEEHYPDTAAELIQKCVSANGGDDEEVAFTIAQCLAHEMDKN
ncbi:unnamed protein product [Phyllotreta striolata]|uniref:Uncharacterized protein n=1 Tax=Phyllotreta striolata TaxID=444603 RepID=A0A9N9TI86_PHYSR|nr:unnamed protein product [Phyllotreta striolata]